MRKPTGAAGFRRRENACSAGPRSVDGIDQAREGWPDCACADGAASIEATMSTSDADERRDLLSAICPSCTTDLFTARQSSDAPLNVASLHEAGAPHAPRLPPRSDTPSSWRTLVSSSAGENGLARKAISRLASSAAEITSSG